MSEKFLECYSKEDIALAVDAYIWAFPRMLYHKYFCDFKKVDSKFNHFYIMNCMSTPDQGGVNVDTLYGVAWLNLEHEPIYISVPDAHDRYYSIQLVDVYANNFNYIGRRLTGTKAGTFLISGPGWDGLVPDGVDHIISPSKYVFGFLRTLIDNEGEDLLKTNEFNGNIQTCPYNQYPLGFVKSSLLNDIEKHFPVAHSNLDKLEEDFFDLLGDALAEDPPRHDDDIDRLKKFERLGIGAGKHPVTADPENQLLFRDAVKIGHEKIFKASSTEVRGAWAGIWDIEKNNAAPLFKATVNRFGIGTLSTGEALYLFPGSSKTKANESAPSWLGVGPDGEPLHGSKCYGLHFENGQLPPVNAFWSLTAYRDNLFLYRNEINRYAIGDRTEGLKYNSDGSLDIYIQHNPPKGQVSNWLPIPNEGFTLFFRAYQPQPAFLNGDYLLSPLILEYTE